MGGLVLAVALGGGALYLFRYKTDHKVTPVGVEDAVADFTARVSDPVFGDPETSHAGVGTAAASGSVLPEPGVYSYTTSGRDGVDALGGAEHVYPELTTMTVTPASCGVSQSWVAAVERSDETLTCAVDGGVETVAFTAFHRFFGADDREGYLCAGDPRPIGAEPGTTWTTTCARDGETAVWSGEILEPAELSIAGESVDVDHVVVTIDNGDPNDSQRTESWYRAGTDLVVRRVVDNATVEGSPIGDVHYTEHYEIELTGLTPSR